MAVLSPEGFEEQLIVACEDHGDDSEALHSTADELICELLISLGYEDGVNIYKQIIGLY